MNNTFVKAARVAEAIVQVKEMVLMDKYNSRENKRITFEPKTKAYVVRLLQQGVSCTGLAREIGLTSTVVHNWKTLYADFDLSSDLGFGDFLGMFDGRQLKHTASQQRSNYKETRKVKECVEVEIEVIVSRAYSALDKLKAKLKMHQEVINKHQKSIDTLNKQITLLAMAKELGLEVELK